tara:strand:+ start:559 stop:1689 length:1131 start_codon:yes stop_codon:yes gene_type:complete
MYKVCKNCIMDTTDQDIYFDKHGICNHCIDFEKLKGTEWFPNEEGEVKLKSILDKVKKYGKNKKYDSIIGLSGGIDSSYLALKVKEYGLRPLVLHVDGGWNSELAVSNIEKIINHCNYDLHTHVVNWKDMKNLQLSYLKSAIANQDVPQDHIFFSSLYHFSIKNKIKYIISGGNLATEAIFPKNWHGSAMDAINLKHIHKTFGNNKLRSYKTISFFQYYILYPILYGMRTIRPLNYLNYNKKEALIKLRKIGYKDYPNKHGESIFTKFFQNYYLPVKFGYDKRKPHYSSMILSGQLSRNDAINLINKKLYSDNELKNDIEFIMKKLELSKEEFDKIMKNKITSYNDYPNWIKYQKIIKFFQKIYIKIFGSRFKVYS